MNNVIINLWVGSLWIALSACSHDVHVHVYVNVYYLTCTCTCTHNVHVNIYKLLYITSHT